MSEALSPKADPVLSSSSPPPSPELTTVNGIGMWNQWTRNFTSPLLALLDLMDNAFDATITAHDDFHAEILVYPDTCTYVGFTGLCLLNNTPKHIKPMAQILEIYQSSKGNQTQSIGANGVGLKQGCATLSDLSICLSKNLNQYSIGIISKSLQRENGCVLPSFSFTEHPSGLQLMQHFIVNAVEGECVKDYGDGSLERGVNRLLQHFRGFEDLQDNDHVFCVILHHLKHGPSEQQNGEEVDYAQNAVGLMNKLKEALPRHYTHVPSTLKVRVDGNLIDFAYWPRRLVELSEFQIMVDPNRAVSEALDWIRPVNGYPLRVFAGFDPLRLDTTDKKAKSALNMFIYSRGSGRLITHSEDARGWLGLNNTGSLFSQGLTILVDDFHGKLPLNPTKQDLAFGEEANGEIHRANLVAWISAVTRLYYNRHQTKFPQKQRRTLLTAEVKRHLPTVQGFQQRDHVTNPLSECSLTRFTNICWTRNSGLIRTQLTKCQRISGADTLIKIAGPPAFTVQEPDAGGGSRKRKANDGVDEGGSAHDDRLLADEFARVYHMLAATMPGEIEIPAQHDINAQMQDARSAQDSSSSDSSNARVENLERINRELRASLEHERKKRRDEQQSLGQEIQIFKEVVKSRDDDKQKLTEALKQKEQEVAKVQRELKLQEGFCQELNSRLAEDRALTFL